MVSSQIFFCLLLQIWTARSNELSSNNIGQILLTYEGYIKASLTLDKTDRELMKNWTTEFQMKQVNITSTYRLDMTRHREHSFRGKKSNKKWGECMSLQDTEIKRSRTTYFNGEGECLRIVNSADKDKTQAVHQVQKEIRKWRKSYRYLSNLCSSDNPDNQDAANICLVEYVKKDNYDVVLQRLLLLKLEAMDALLNNFTAYRALFGPPRYFTWCGRTKLCPSRWCGTIISGVCKSLTEINIYLSF